MQLDEADHERTQTLHTKNHINWHNKPGSEFKWNYITPNFNKSSFH